MKRARLSLLVLALSAACDDTFVKGWLVDRTRVLGARVEVVSEPARASIAPGEPAKVTWIVGAPNGTGRLEWAFAGCAPPVGLLPEPHCEGPTLVSGSGTSDGELVPMDVVAPPAEALGDARALLLLAAFCEHGAPSLDARKFEATCDGGAPALLASATMRLSSSGPNRNPEIVSEGVLFDGAAMPASTARVGPSCIGGGSPTVVAGSAHGFTFRFRNEDREPAAESGGAPETLIASHVATAGELDRQYSALEPGDAAPKEVAIPWTAPSKEEVPSGSRLVEVFFVLRDGRGGLAFARRTVCVRTP
jgi:hypothetical protein